MTAAPARKRGAKAGGRSAATAEGNGSGNVDAFTRVLGRRMRDERQKRGITVRGLAARLGISASLLSQIERGQVKPSVETLWTTVNELGLSLDDLFTEAGGTRGSRQKAADATGDNPVRRPGSRKRISLARGVQWERLSAQSDPSVDFVLVTYDVGAASSMDGTLYRHAGNEYGYIVSGELAVSVGFEEYRLGPGDSISFQSTQPHRLRNIGRKPVVAVWFVQHPPRSARKARV